MGPGTRHSPWLQRYRNQVRHFLALAPRCCQMSPWAHGLPRPLPSCADRPGAESGPEGARADAYLHDRRARGAACARGRHRRSGVKPRKNCAACAAAEARGAARGARRGGAGAPRGRGCAAVQEAGGLVTPQQLRRLYEPGG